MDVFDTITKRRSIRKFQTAPVENEKLERILSAIQLVPSAGNLQAYEVIVIRDSRRKIELARAAWGQRFIDQAPVVLAFVANPERNVHRYHQRGASLYSVQDATIACTYAHLAATALGLGSVWVGAFDDAAVAEILNVQPPLRPVALLPVGYPAESPSPRQRRPLEDIVHEEHL